VVLSAATVALNELDVVVARMPSVSQTGGDSSTSIYTYVYKYLKSSAYSCKKNSTILESR